ncbi:MAG: nucleoside diphosphate kinase regulator [Anaerolineaceae bacterium]|nr:nucleoside diphosphate kinase regulator [Anaerolineaceae bacterium]
MSQANIYITQVDADKIRNLLWEAKNTNYRGSPYLKQLAKELDRAVIVQPQEIPPDVITMNSTAVLLDIDTGEEMRYTLVFPEAADITQGKISILAPIGTGMLGFRVGDSFEWDTPGGKRVIRVEKVLFQPEATGDYQ